jgi:hypothetical protein
MLGPFDWYTVLEIGIAAAVVVVMVLVMSRPPRPTRWAKSWGDYRPLRGLICAPPVAMRLLGTGSTWTDIS